MCEHPPHFHLLVVFNLSATKTINDKSIVSDVKHIKCHIKLLTVQFYSLRIARNFVCHTSNRCHHCHHCYVKFSSDSVDLRMDHIRTTSNVLDCMLWQYCARFRRPILHTRTHSLYNLRKKYAKYFHRFAEFRRVRRSITIASFACDRSHHDIHM